MVFSATYSPEDNKLRLYASARLDKELYDKVRAEGFIYAPKQGLFVAPTWTPSREDFLLTLVDEIEPEETSMDERAEARADRFSGYQERRTRDGENAFASSQRSSERFRDGAPILVDHHSAKAARRDQERSHDQMRKAVQAWKTAEYWEDRAAASKAHAEYLAAPTVRYRRIKKLCSEQRMVQRNIKEIQEKMDKWNSPALTLEEACELPSSYRIEIANPSGDPGTVLLRSALQDGIKSLGEAVALLNRICNKDLSRSDRWLQHISNRIAYEKKMLEADGGLTSTKHDYQVGGRVKTRFSWEIIKRINKVDGVVNSLSVVGAYGSISLDDIFGYEPPKAGMEEKVKRSTRLPPLCNYPGPGFREMTKEQWKSCGRSDLPQTMVHKATEGFGAHRTRVSFGYQFAKIGVYLTDAKRVDPPAVENAEVAKEQEEIFDEDPATEQQPNETTDTRTVAPPPAQPALTLGERISMAHSELERKVPVVAISDLYPTPSGLANRMVALADIRNGHSILEPSAGNGSILSQIIETQHQACTAVELDRDLCAHLRAKFPRMHIIQHDFLSAEIGVYDRVLMNPPFDNAADIKHIERALSMLKPGGRLVAVCANGPRQQRILQPKALESGGSWESLPSGTFKDCGTNVNTVLLVINAR